MDIKKATLFLIPLSLLAKETPPPPRYDADLFRKNVEVYMSAIEFLYWQPTEGALDFALKMNKSAWSPTTSYAQGKVQKAHYNIDPGFRLTAGYFNAPKYYEVKGQYTRLTAYGTQGANDPSGVNEFLTGTFASIIDTPLTKAMSHLHFNYNVFDILVQRVFHPNPHVRLRLIGGVGAAWMEQDWRVTYLNAASENTNIHNLWNFAGGGMRIGFSGDWYWGNNIYAVGLFTTGLLFGRYHNVAKQTTNAQPTGDDNPSLPVRDFDLVDNRGTCNMQLSLGPAWEQNFTNTRVELFAGYELNAWWNLQEIYRSTSGAPAAAKETWMTTSLLTLQGLSVRLSIDI